MIGAGLARQPTRERRCGEGKDRSAARHVPGAARGNFTVTRVLLSSAEAFTRKSVTQGGVDKAETNFANH